MILHPVAALALAAVLAASAAAAGERQIEAPARGGPLRGTLLAPRAGSPVVLVIPGSGMTDRDGNSPGLMRAAPYRLIAEGLAAHGIASVRIDKRGMFASAGALADANAVTIGDYAADVRAWIGAIRRETGAPCAWLLGHSEGGVVALAAAQSAPDLCGLVLVATPGRPMGEVLRWQLQASGAGAPLLDPALSAIDALEAGRRVDAATLPPALMALFRPAVQGFLIDLFSHDPARLIAAVRKPVLILQGTRDIQVGARDAERLRQAAPATELRLLPDVNHVLKTVGTEDRRENVATYSDAHLPLAPGVIDGIAGFIARAGAGG